MADKGLTKQEKQRLKEKQKFERERQQWKRQEARQRTKKTSKKDRGPALVKLVAILVLVALVLGGVAIYAGSYGLPGRFLPALTVGGQNVLTPVWAYNFSNLYRSIYQYGMYYGLDTNASIFGQPAQEGGTWDAAFTSQVHQSLQNELALYAEAKKAGYRLSEEDQKSLDDAVAELDGIAVASAMSVGAYLRNQYVPGITKKVFRELEERKLVVAGFVEQKQEEYRALHPMAELQVKYDADPNAYNQVDYRVYSFPIEQAEAVEGETPEEHTARQLEADEAALAKAKEFLREGGTEAGFIAAAQALYDAQHQHEEEEEPDHTHDYDADASTLMLRKRRADIEGAYGEGDNAAWFFDAARKAGDSTTLETDANVYAVLLLRTPYAQTTVDFYTINVEIPEADPAAAEGDPTPKEKAKESADALLAKWQENGGTQEAFKALVDEQVSVAEAQENADAGLSEKMGPGDTGIAEMDTWLFDSARKAGDAAVIEASGSCKVVYLVSQNADNFTWESEISDALVEADYTKYVEGLHELYPLGHHGIGMRFALASAKKMCDEYMEFMKQQSAASYNYS